MDKKKKKTLVKSARKVIREELHGQLIADIEQTLTKFGQESKQIKKEIKKSVGKLAKRLATKFKIELTETSDQGDTAVVTSKVEESKTITPIVAKVAPVKTQVKSTAPVANKNKAAILAKEKAAEPVTK
jgi:hypothetical protein